MNIVRPICLALLSMSALACSGDDATGATEPVVVDTTDLRLAASSDTPDFPTSETAGVGADVRLSPWTGSYRLSENDAVGTPTTVEGKQCVLYDGVDVNFAMSGEYLYVDVPCAVFRNSRFSTSGSVANTSALVQQSSENELLNIEHCDFDGGPTHQRGVQADYGDVVVTASEFARFGNAAVEMDDPSATRSFTVTDSYLEETPGWANGDHVDGLQVGAGGAITIRHNTILVAAYGG
ncbi:MAG: hypothetical protein WCC60_15160, partial [Ilumatobacteraceae bacterium]